MIGWVLVPRMKTIVGQFVANTNVTDPIFCFLKRNSATWFANSSFADFACNDAKHVISFGARALALAIKCEGAVLLFI